MSQKYRITTVSLPHSVKRVKNNLEKTKPFLKQAGELKTDFCCLPECFAYHSISDNYTKVGEEIPGGLTSSFLSLYSRKFNMNIIATSYEKEGDKIYNCGVIFNRKGKLVGKYKKVHLPQGEIDEGIDSGSQFPVFCVDGMVLGILICYDLNYPESARILALKGADVIFWPNMWGRSYMYVDCIMRTRAMENLIYLVSANYSKDDRRSCIVSWNGKVLAEVDSRPGIASAVIDLSQPRFSQASSKELLLKHRKPHLYREILDRWHFNKE